MEAQERRGSRVRTISILIVVAIVLIIVGVPYAMTMSSQGCAQCHSMKPYFQTWKASVHETAASHCSYCHVKPGILNNVAYRVLFWREIWAEMTNMDLGPIGVTVPVTESCYRARCHSLNREINPRGDLIIKHREHVLKAELTCIDCHPGTVHAGVNGIPDATPSRELCTECHADRMSECDFCHTEPKRLRLDFEH